MDGCNGAEVRLPSGERIVTLRYAFHAELEDGGFDGPR